MMKDQKYYQECNKTSRESWKFPVTSSSTRSTVTLDNTIVMCIITGQKFTDNKQTLKKCVVKYLSRNMQKLCLSHINMLCLFQPYVY